jgi:hypothetical protein
MIDRGGAKYIARQELYMAQRYANLIEFQTASMLRGSYTFDQDGDILYHRFTGGEYTINYQLPANNKNQLNGIIGTVWSNTASDIPLDCFDINAQSVQDTGLPIEHVIVSSTIWNHVVNNTKVINQGGSSNLVFETISRVGAGEFSARLRAIPWLQWHIVDYGLDVWDGSSETFTRLIPTDVAVFLPNPSMAWTAYIRGCEYVTEGPNGVRDLRKGFYPYAYPHHDPSGWRLNAVHNGFPALYLPKALYYATVTGF